MMDACVLLMREAWAGLSGVLTGIMVEEWETSFRGLLMVVAKSPIVLLWSCFMQ